MCLRPWLSESQGSIRIQCFLDSGGERKGGCMSHDRATKESFTLCSKDNQHHYSSHCSSIIQLASSKGRRTDDIQKENTWSHTCQDPSLHQPVPIPREALHNLLHTCSSLQPFSSIIQTEEKRQLVTPPKDNPPVAPVAKCHS